MKKKTFTLHEKKLIESINEAKQYVEGELEMGLYPKGWYAMDYKVELGGAFLINKNGYNTKPLISLESIDKYNIDVIACFNECDVTYVL